MVATRRSLHIEPWTCNILESLPHYKNYTFKRNTDRRQRPLYRCHTRYKRTRLQHCPPPCPTKTPQKKSKFKGWGSFNTLFHTVPLIDNTVSAQEELFLATHDPSCIMKFYPTLTAMHPAMQNTHQKRQGVVNVHINQGLISSPKYPSCFSNSTVEDNVIIDSGVSVCISPHKTDFKTYGPSGMTIKDLSFTNRVTGEGLLQWQLQDKNGHTVIMEVFGYQIPAAKVCLLSPQFIISENGGHSMMTEEGIDIKLGNGIEIFGRYCQQSNLPLIP